MSNDATKRLVDSENGLIDRSIFTSREIDLDQNVLLAKNLIILF